MGHALAKEHLDAFDTYEQVDKNEKNQKDDGKDVQASIISRRSKWVEGKGYFIVAKGEIGGLSTDKFLVYRSKMSPGKVNCTSLDNTDGASYATHMKIKFPWPMSDRSLINAFYFSEEELSKGIYTQCSSGRGNEALVEAEKKNIGKNVLGCTHLDSCVLRTRKMVR